MSKNLIQCVQCVYFRVKDRSDVGRDVEQTPGTCHCLPPNMQGFPPVMGNDFCGSGRKGECPFLPKERIAATSQYASMS